MNVGKTLYIVVPCYNESELLLDSAHKLTEKLERLIENKKISASSMIMLVDDGSTDDSWKIIKELCKSNNKICAISLAHNRGHQNALIAGLMTAKSHTDITITIDADLQQDIEAIDDFLNEYSAGNEIVYGIRNNRNTDGRFKKSSAGLYYSLMRLFGVNIYKDSADYRLLSRRALDALEKYNEVNLFLRGIIPDIGLKSSVVYYDVFPRKIGESKYSFGKMLRLAINGITSFTIMPIHIISAAGLLSIIISIVMIVVALIDWIQGKNVPGYSTILISIWFIGGLLLFGLGIVGEYIGQAYMETKHRPRYFIKESCMNMNNEEELKEEIKQ